MHVCMFNIKRRISFSHYASGEVPDVNFKSQMTLMSGIANQKLDDLVWQRLSSQVYQLNRFGSEPHPVLCDKCF